MEFISEVNLVNWLQQQGNGLFYTRDCNNISMRHEEDYKVDFVCITGYQRIINEFFDNILPKLKSPVVLIIIETDFYNFNNKDLDNPNLKHIITWNNPRPTHSKISSLPIGLNHYSHEGSLYNFFTNNPKNRERETEYWVGYNFRPHTAVRMQLAEKVKEWESFCHQLPTTPPLNKYRKQSYTDGQIDVVETHPDCYKEMSKCKYILSPPGVGIDCHRTWEALYMGCIPIVERSNISDLYEDLPILVLDNWNDLSLDLLKEHYDEYLQLTYINNGYNMQKLDMNYWTDKISKLLKGEE